jgi:hypothetical protein
VCETKHVLDNDAQCNKPQAAEVSYSEYGSVCLENMYTETKGVREKCVVSGLIVWMAAGRLISCRAFGTLGEGRHDARRVCTVAMVIEKMRAVSVRRSSRNR